MRPEVKEKLKLLALGILTLAVLLMIGRTGQKAKENREEDNKREERQEEPSAEREAQETPPQVPVPVYNGRIRVLIKTDGYRDVYHEALEITGEEEAWVFRREEGTYYINDAPVEETDFPVILEERETGKWTIGSLNRAYGHPAMEGSLEIYGTEQGFVLVNDLPLECYLKYVVPSEMPASYELEALKAQAVCARTYACMQMQAYAYPEYLAHVDDSVSYQVYQNLDEAERSSQAVAETTGQVMTYEGQIIHAYYFSTSFGHTGNEEIWWEGDPQQTPYLKGKCVNASGENLDLTSEEAFAAFLEETDEGCYDRPISWYRWNTRVDVDTLSEHLNQSLMDRYKANPEAILNIRAGKFVSAPVKSVGTIEEITVLERGEGGVLQKIEVKGSRRTVQIMTEYNIRALLNAQGETIYRHDGSQAEGGALLPSGYCSFSPEYEDGELVAFTIRGGGLGHGVGMSQNGANQMAKEGYSFGEILKFFYTGVDLTGVDAVYS